MSIIEQIEKDFEHFKEIYPDRYEVTLAIARYVEDFCSSGDVISMDELYVAIEDDFDINEDCEELILSSMGYLCGEVGLLDMIFASKSSSDILDMTLVGELFHVGLSEEQTITNPANGEPLTAFDVLFMYKVL